MQYRLRVHSGTIEPDRGWGNRNRRMPELGTLFFHPQIPVDFLQSQDLSSCHTVSCEVETARAFAIGQVLEQESEMFSSNLAYWHMISGVLYIDIYNIIMLLHAITSYILLFFQKFHILGGPMISQSPQRFRMRRRLSILWSQDAHWTYDVGFLSHRAPGNCFCKGILWDDSHACHTVKAAHVLVSSQRHFRSSDDGTILLQRALLQLWWWERFACKQFLVHLCNSFLVRVSYMYFLYSSRFFNNKYSSSSHLYPQDTHKIPIGYSQAVFPSQWSLSKDLFCTPISQCKDRT